MSVHSVHQGSTPTRVGSSRPPGKSSAHAVTRILLHLALAAVPLLAISAEVFGAFPMRTSAALIVIPLVIIVAVLTLFAPHPSDRIVGAGLLWGMLACVVYDVFRLDTVYMLGWWGDFIPTMGSWITGGRPGAWDGAVAGYVWRYVGDGGGIGVAFFVLAAALGLGRRRRRDVVLAGVAFAVFPVWAGLMATVALAPRGEAMMFPLTATTVTLSLIGHLIFGLVMGLGFWHTRGIQRHWPWQAASGRALPAVLPDMLLDSRRRSPAVTGNDGRYANRNISRATYEEWQRELQYQRSTHRRSRHADRANVYPG